MWSTRQVKAKYDSENVFSSEQSVQHGADAHYYVS
ncbi:BBE domain-containing protein [Mycolicibacterium moriokaense]